MCLYVTSVNSFRNGRSLVRTAVADKGCKFEQKYRGELKLLDYGKSCIGELKYQSARVPRKVRDNDCCSTKSIKNTFDIGFLIFVSKIGDQ